MSIQRAARHLLLDERRREDRRERRGTDRLAVRGRAAAAAASAGRRRRCTTGAGSPLRRAGFSCPACVSPEAPLGARANGSFFRSFSGRTRGEAARAVARILIAGCGYVGTSSPRARAEGHEVWALRRSEARRRPRRAGDPRGLADVDRLRALPPRLRSSFTRRRPMAATTAPIAALTSTDCVTCWPRSTVTRSVASSIRSSTGVYTQSAANGSTRSPRRSRTHFSGRRLLEGEHLLLGRRFPATVVRLAGIYGPGPGEARRAGAAGRSGHSGRRPSLREPHPSRRLCRGAPPRHGSGEPGAAVRRRGPRARRPRDRAPLDRAAAACPTAARRGRRDRRVATAATSNKSVRNARLLASGYRFRYPTFREGYGEMIARRPHDGGLSHGRTMRDSRDRAPRTVDAVVRRARRGREAAAHVLADRRRPLEPHVQGRGHRRSGVRASPPAALARAGERARHGARAQDHLGALADTRAGAASARLLSGSRGQRRAVLRHAVRARRGVARRGDRQALARRAGAAGAPANRSSTCSPTFTPWTSTPSASAISPRRRTTSRASSSAGTASSSSRRRVSSPPSTACTIVLKARIPEQGRASVVHGDYRLGNCITDPQRGQDRRSPRLGDLHARRSARGRRLRARHLDAIDRSRRRRARRPVARAGVPVRRRDARALRGAARAATSRRSTSTWRSRSGRARASSRASTPATSAARSARPTSISIVQDAHRSVRRARRAGGGADELSRTAIRRPARCESLRTTGPRHPARAAPRERRCRARRG